MAPAAGAQGVEAGDEWIKVRRKGRRIKSHHPVLPPSNTSNSGPKQRPSSLSVSDVEREHRHIRDQWRASTGCRRLRDVVASCDCGSAITDAICFGLGSFDPEDGSWENKRRAHIQLSAFLYMVEQLQCDKRVPIRCLFQEPIFNSVDEAFIRSLGYEVVYSPNGFEQVSTSTLVFGIHLYRDIYAHALANNLPAVFVGTPREVWEECRASDIPDWDRLKELDDRCDKVEFPEDSGYTTFSSTVIHWRRQSGT
ncbi:uncharacterized protein GGS22DRAFT_128933 [Annulohypoxylon maeteangense]|uniref:uncharacterized protein n=1 Tax=Annulohypoxylon maeteangense TaxID=1927788 RepID=UPI00200823FD|nr:uncharacterized protein GGS22DRAFT_128933 [Annulohypoxylon maeteangense]KAI0886452.1 hypothetical protein GGS22DRAFT_128933 [Annulohypoxylon maeteangense]